MARRARPPATNKGKWVAYYPIRRKRWEGLSDGAASWDSAVVRKTDTDSMAENAKQVMDIRPSAGITTAQSNEHQRRWTEKGWEHAVSKGNYDPTRERLNFEVVKGGKVQPVDKSKSIPERMAENLRSRGIRDRNEGLAEPKYRTVVNFIFGGSQLRMRELAFGDQEVDFDKGADNSSVRRMPEIEKWAQDIYAFVSGKFGEENIVGFYVHLDELNPHIHCTLLPIKDGEFAYKKIFSGRDKYEGSRRFRELHNELAAINWKWELRRGTSVAITGARHRSTEEYRRHLNEECTTLEEQVEQYRMALDDLRVEIRLAERRVKGLHTMVENLKKEQLEKETQLQAYRQELQSQSGDAMSLAGEISRLEKELAAVRDKLADKQEKLETADRQLAVLKEDMDAIQNRTGELREEAYRYSRDIHAKTDSLLKDVLVEHLVCEHRERMAHSDVSERKSFDGTLMQAVAEQGSEVLHCATLLFLGYVDAATTFAEGQGGGGGGNSLKWGRDEDEDDRHWAYRCMMEARRLMRPTAGRKPKR